MLKTALFCIFVCTFFCAIGQNNDPWIRFYDSTKELNGFKDLKGNIRIPAKFGLLIRVDSFYNIMPVVEDTEGFYQQYYLLKDGRKIGKDSVFSFDFNFNCESEEKIIFSDWKKDRVGFLDKMGKVIIPAIYNYASPFRNGMALVHRNAKRACWDESEDTSSCEHLGWAGGETILINEKNEILADSISVGWSYINWYSATTNPNIIDTSISVNITGRNGVNYYFIDYNKEFDKWFSSTFLPALNDTHSLSPLLFEELTFRDPELGWTALNKDAFLKKYKSVFDLNRFKSSEMKTVSLDQGIFNEFIFDKEIYKKYVNACGQHRGDLFPFFEVMLTYYKKRLNPIPDISSEFWRENEIDYQEHFEFLKTENGYQLLSVSVKN